MLVPDEEPSGSRAYPTRTTAATGAATAAGRAATGHPGVPSDNSHQTNRGGLT